MSYNIVLRGDRSALAQRLYEAVQVLGDGRRSAITLEFEPGHALYIRVHEASGDGRIFVETGEGREIVEVDPEAGRIKASDLRFDEEYPTVHCPHGDTVGHYPDRIPVILSEEEIIRVQQLLRRTSVDDTLARKFRAYQIASFAEWHG